jgi:hypothetical protein
VSSVIREVKILCYEGVLVSPRPDQEGNKLQRTNSPDMLLFSFYNKKRLAIRHMNRPLFPTTLTISSYDIGK